MEVSCQGKGTGGTGVKWDNLGMGCKCKSLICLSIEHENKLHDGCHLAYDGHARAPSIQVAETIYQIVQSNKPNPLRAAAQSLDDMPQTPWRMQPREPHFTSGSTPFTVRSTTAPFGTLSAAASAFRTLSCSHSSSSKPTLILTKSSTTPYSAAHSNSL